MKGILMRPNLIPLIVDGRKIVTSRLMKPQPTEGTIGLIQHGEEWLERILTPEGEIVQIGDYTRRHKPHYKVVDGIVYIKEAWAVDKLWDDLKPSEINSFVTVYYFLDAAKKHKWAGKWRSPLLMPSKFARYFIKITDVRAERLQEITEEDAVAEGCNPTLEPIFIPNQENIIVKYGEASYTAKMNFAYLWDSINPEHPWASNPFIWRYSFKFFKKEVNNG